jgi:hypothetical protein
MVLIYKNLLLIKGNQYYLIVNNSKSKIEPVLLPGYIFNLLHHPDCKSHHSVLCPWHLLGK